jgi:hypothetical protein
VRKKVWPNKFPTLVPADAIKEGSFGEPRPACPSACLWCAQKVAHRLRGGNQDGKEREKAEEFHVVRCVEKADVERSSESLRQ